MVRTSTRVRRPATYRPLVERLEDRLPPGDTGLLAGAAAERAAGLVPAVRDTRPGPARPLAEAEDFTLLAGEPGRGSAETLVGRISNPSYGFSVLSTQYSELGTFTRPRALAETPTLLRTPAPDASTPLTGGPVHFLGASPAFVSPLPTNYQLDQAAAAFTVPVADDPGAEVRSSGTHALFDLGHPTTGPFPANVFTVPDDAHNTSRRVDLPLPDCKVYVSDCEDIAVLNELDGFNLQPRLSVPFSGPIDVKSVTNATVFLISLGSTVPGQGFMPRGTVVGINQIVWDVETNTLHVESDALLAQHTRFALIVTNDIRDADGDRVEASREFRRFRETAPPAYRRELEEAIQVARRLGVWERQMVTASVFTTQSATAILEKIRDQIKAETPKPADFLLGEKGERTVFNLDEVTGIMVNRQTQVDPPGFAPPAGVSFSLLQDIIPGAVGQIAFGKFLAPDYQIHPGEYIPAVATRTGVPRARGTNELFFNLYLPSGSKPAGGWPVAIYGHGGGGSKDEANLFAASLASQGIATLSISVVGHGFGPLSTLTVTPTMGKPLTFAAAGRGIDQDDDNTIVNQEGSLATAPRRTLLDRDARRQAAADLMQLVRVIQVGIDADGDGIPDLDSSRVNYFGFSFGAVYGVDFVAVDPSVQVGVFAAAAGAVIEGRTRGPGSRGTFATRQLAPRVPPVVNNPGITELDGVPVAQPHFNENRPLRNGVPLTVRLEDGTSREIRSPVINTVSGAMALQELLEHIEWGTMSGDALAHAPHLRKHPLPGVPPKSVLFQFSKGDYQAVNPGNTALLRAGGLTDVGTYYRHDLAYAENPVLPQNPHSFIASIGNKAWRDVALGAQSQIAAFFASDGKTIIHPEPKRFFEVPINGPLPEELNYIP